MNKVSEEREYESRRIESIQEQTEKINELLKESSANIERLKSEQEKMMIER